MTTPNPTTDSNESLGVYLSTASIACFAATSLLLSYINQTYALDGWVTATYRGAIGLIAIYLMQSRTGQVKLGHMFTNKFLFLRGFIGGSTIPLYYICIMEIGPGRAGMITGSYPLFAALFAMIFIKEHVRWTYGIYITIALAGLIGIFFDDGLSGGKPSYDLLAIFGAGAAGICVVLIRHLRHTENTSTIFASQCVVTLALGLAVSGKDIFITDPAALGLTILAGVLVVIAQLCITESFRHINVAKGSTLQMLTPATTCLFSAILLGEAFSIPEIAGGLAILFASYQIVMMKAKR